MTAITLSPKAADGSPITASVKPDRPKLTFISHNFCDRTTWFGQSTRVVDEVATDDGDHQNYTVAHGPMIDLYHGRVTFEDFKKDALGNSYRVVVKVDDVVKSEQDPHYASGGDFTVDYVTHKVHFLTPLVGTEVVKVTYHYAGGSVYVIQPVAGKLLIIDRVEVQFAIDIVLKDTFLFQAYGLVDVFAPQLMGPPWNIPSGTKIPLGDPLMYKTFLDLLNDSNSSYPAYPAFGGDNWRALPKTSYLFTWQYEVGVTVLNPDYGMEIRVWMEHDEPCEGAFGVASVYCTSEDIPA